MGAFGKLLESRFGSTKHDVKTWNSDIKNEKTKFLPKEKSYNHFNMIPDEQKRKEEEHVKLSIEIYSNN